MEKHCCKLCSRTFANGRALGGHMRSHVTAIAPSQKAQEQQEEEEEEEEEGKESSPSLFSSEEEDEGKAQALYYGLRENPKKSFRLVDPEFSFAIDAGSVVQDRESETESSKNPLRRRSKRQRRSKLEPEQEPVSSVSDTTPEEDVALCLMMLSRDIWMRDRRKDPFEESEEGKEENEEDPEQEQEIQEEEKMRFCPRGRNKYQCGTCKKVFRSYQALGGHRASHKKIKTCSPPSPVAKFQAPDSRIAVGNRKIHECPFCFRVFKSGQALGGHKRSHLSASGSASASPPAPPTPPKFGDNLIDLNLPAPMEDDEFSQVELSAVSDAEFVDPAN